MNRFSKDIDTMDVRLAGIVRSWIGCLMKTLTIPIVIGYSTPWFLVTMVPLTILYIVVQVGYQGNTIHVCYALFILTCCMLLCYGDDTFCVWAISFNFLTFSIQTQVKWCSIVLHS